jgi:hypothetical protein
MAARRQWGKRRLPTAQLPTGIGTLSRAKTGFELAMKKKDGPKAVLLVFFHGFLIFFNCFILFFYSCTKI